MAILLKSNGERIEVKPENGRDFKRKELCKMLECEMIEPVYLWDGRVMIIDEEGKFYKCDINPWATGLLHRSGGMHDDFVVGDALVCTAEQFY